MLGIFIIGDVLGITHEHNNKWLVGFDVDYNDGRGKIWTSSDPNKAMRFNTVQEALAAYNTQSKVHPIRLTDGKPNRPNRTYTINIQELP